MSTYCDLPIAPILEAVEKWKQRCVIEQRSLFGDGAIWCTEYLDEIRKNFIERPDDSTGNFLAKLKTQLGDSPPEVSQLAAELAWLMYLFPHGSMGPKVKLDNLSAIWKMSGADLPQTHWALKPDVLNGIGSTGTFYNTGFWVEFAYAVLVFLKLFALDAIERAALMKPDAKFSDWLDSLTLIERLPGGPPLNPGKRQFRQIMLFLFQPDRYERISSTQQKRDIVKRLAPQVGLQPDLSTSAAVDRQLFEIRQALEQRYGTKEIDFYRPPVKQLWQDSTPAEKLGVAEPKSVYVTETVANYWLTGAYWEGDDLSPTFVSEGRWENGYTDRLLEQVKAVQVGDRIALKSTYVQKNDLPFDNRGKPVSCMAIKARGVVTENVGDGRNLKVDWEPAFKPFVIYHYTYRPTISRTECVILSADKGFDPLLSHLNKNGLSCRRVSSMGELVPNAMVKVATDDPERTVCPKCRKASTIEHHGGRWCSNCGSFAVKPDPSRLPSATHGSWEQRRSPLAERTEIMPMCSWCHQQKDMSTGIYDDGEWMCGDCVAGYQ